MSISHPVKVVYATEMSDVECIPFFCYVWENDLLRWEKNIKKTPVKTTVFIWIFMWQVIEQVSDSYFIVNTKMCISVNCIQDKNQGIKL